MAKSKVVTEAVKITKAVKHVAVGITTILDHERRISALEDILMADKSSDVTEKAPE